MNNNIISLDDIDAIVFDFDGVLTNNLVHIDQNGKETVSCNRSDGLAFDVLLKLEIPTFILSTEKNPVVTARANKLMVSVLQGKNNKLQSLVELANLNNYKLERILYVGNDLNDYRVMQRCGYSVCPADSHPIIKRDATIILNNNGGDGVARELLEDVLHLDFIKILYPE
jgi:3-deoxy-D-manno-octulosonate 8-phosphate phosphatase (KDO 8-P phosphatase)